MSLLRRAGFTTPCPSSTTSLATAATRRTVVPIPYISQRAASARKRHSSLSHPSPPAIRTMSSSASATTNGSAPARRFQRPVVFVCDIQEKFRNAIWNFDKVVATTSKVLRAAHILNLPVHTTTQNGARLGGTVPELTKYLDPSAPDYVSVQPGAVVHPTIDKTRFSMWVPDVVRNLQEKDLARRSGSGEEEKEAKAEVILVGIESHICITQTALDLLANGHKVYVLADGVSSCNRQEVGIALARLREEGATVTTSESVIYELMGDAKVPEFKGIVGVVKDTSAETKQVLQALL